MEDALAEAEGNAVVTVVDLATGVTETYGDAEHEFDTASIVKVDL